MTDGRGHKLTPAEEAEWRALNEDNAQATSKQPTRSEYEETRGSHATAERA